MTTTAALYDDSAVSRNSSLAAPHGTSPSNRIAKHLDPQPIPVTGIKRDICVKIASTAEEWEQAFHLVSERYKDMGYVHFGAQGMHFTPYHVLPATETFVAKEGDRVVATVSLIPDNQILGLPMEEIYGEEISHLRRAGHRLSEISCLANTDFAVREFLPVFLQLCRLMLQYGESVGSDDWVISVNPRHVGFYKKFWGFEPIGPRRSYSAVEGAPAEAFFLDRDLMHEKAPKTHDVIFTEPVPEESLTPVGIPPRLARRFAAFSSRTDFDAVDNLLKLVGRRSIGRG
jgi:hypothetical protein